MLKASSNGFKPLAKKRAFMQIADQVKASVYSGAYKPNDKLPTEQDLATQFNAGRLAVREALRVLEGSGFIAIKQGSQGGAFIKSIGSTVVKRSLADYIRLGNVSVQDLTGARLAIKLSAAAYAIKRITDEEMVLLHQNIMSTQRLGKNGAETAGSNVNFHMLMAKSAKNRLVETILASILDIYLTFFKDWDVTKQFRVNHLNEHVQIYKALQRRDPDKLKEATQKRIFSISRHFREAVRRIDLYH